MKLQISPPHLSDIATVPWEIQKSHFQQYYSYILLIIYIISQENTPPENVTTLTYKLQNFFHLTEGLLCFFKRWRLWKLQLWVVVGGSEKKRLWCVATGMSGKQRHSKCSEWPPTVLIHASSLFLTLTSRIVHHAVLKFSPCRNKPLLQASTCPYQYTHSTCSVPQTQY